MQPDFPADRSRRPVFRFAPSPNGHLHLGHASSALLNAEMARTMDGRLLVRIEDIDTLRCTDQLVADCLEDLAWLGLAWEEPVLRQSAHFARYRSVAADLEAAGYLYPCFCTRSDITRAAADDPTRDPDGAPRYPGTCRTLAPEERVRRIAAKEPHALRLDMARAGSVAGPAIWREEGEIGREREGSMPSALAWGDVVMVRKDCPTSYHLSVVLDDAAQGVTHVVRGVDLFAATAIHRVLQELLGLPAPIYYHHALIRDRDGRKLSKSTLSTPLRQLRAEGVTPGDIRQRLGFDQPGFIA